MQLNKDVFNSFPVLKTHRLTLREITEKDAESIFKMRRNENVNRFIARPPIGDFKNAKALAKKTQKAFYNQQAIGFAGVLRDKDEIIGTCGFNRIDYNNLRAEIGGEMDPKYWGKGIAEEAVREIIRFGFEALKLVAIEAWVSPNNRGAMYILSQLGFEKEAHFKDYVYFNNEFKDMAVMVCHNG
ncbi:MAG: GNAT family N-acetyltransferase [Bacteroidia bacterium]